MTKEKQNEKIQQFATDLLNVSVKVSNIIMEETHEFISQKHKYNSLKDFHEAHPKGRNLMEAEFLTELGYVKASEVAREIFEEIEKEIRSSVKVIITIKDKEEDGWYDGQLNVLGMLGKFIAELKQKYTEEGNEKRCNN